MTELTSNLDLLIGQWNASPRIRALIQVYLDIANQDILPALEAIRLQRQIETATGISLDYLGRRLGIERPPTSDPSQDTRFGFETAGEGFDQVPFGGDAENEALFPLPDSIYRRLLRARTIALLSDGTLNYLINSIRAIDPSAIVQDRRDMTIRVVTDFQSILELADDVGALARNAGVRINYVSTNRFGFDDVGDAYDQAPYGVN